MANINLYGFYGLSLLASDRVVGNNVPVVSDAIDRTFEEHNRQMNSIYGLFVKRTTQFKTKYLSPVAARLQPLDSNGRARKIIPVGNYDIAFPIQEGGLAWGANYVSKTKMTVAEAQRVTKTLMDADIRWMRDHIMAALFTNASWSFDDTLQGTLTIMPLANNDTQQYLITSGSDQGATANNFGAQTASIDDSHNPFPTIYSNLNKHPENAGEVICFVPTNLIDSVSALTTFREVGDPDVQVGANTAQLVGTLDTPVPGVIRGKANKCWVVEWRTLPDNYIISVTTDGDAPLWQREDEEVELQGYKKVAERSDHPFWESQWLRRAGFGAANRVGAYVYMIGGSSYTVPTNYTSPMA